ncbi:MAG: NADH-quinone oxidoreductase subunit NuoF [Deltaproteobacteria bacterium]|nr:NADH-quinone oxidoreductase subunit NuoF [Deltaproteobacteria bacterium]
MAPRILTARFGVPGSHTLEVARACGVYADLGRVLRLEAEAIAAQVRASGLRGRGGAGFPTGAKWGFVPPPERRQGRPVHLFANADESEPGTFKDRVLLWHDPHRVIEGTLVAARALCCHRVWIYLRGEFRFLQERIDAALGEARQANLVGPDILGSGFDCEIRTFRGAGAYVCGEESGLLESVEGRRGLPRIKPPYPALVGAFGDPTVVQNVETLANLPWILEHGAQAYRAWGTEASSGTRLFSVSGPVRRPGVYELPLGTPFRELLEGCAGGLRPGRRLLAVLPGGSSTPLLTAEQALGATLDHECLEALGSFLGSGGVIVLDDSVDPVAALANLTRFYAHESCGQCTPCREGCGWMARIAARVAAGEGRQEDLVTLEDLARSLRGRTLCAFGDAAAAPVLSFLETFRPAFLARVRP